MDEEKRKNSSNDKTGAYILIGIGIVFLLVNVLNINFSRLWPLILVAVGVYMLFGRNSIGSTAKTGRFRAAREGAQSADVTLHLSVGEATVQGLAEGDDLIDAELTYVGDVRFDVSGEEHKVVHLRQSGDSAFQWINPANWFGNKEKYAWHVGLNTSVPTDLDIHGGVGKSDLHLRDLTVTDLKLHGGVGEVIAYLPASAQGYNARIQGGVGEIRLQLPDGTPLDLDVQGGVGEITLDTEAVEAIRLEASGGISDVSVPSRLRQVRGSNAEFELGKSGIWETDGYADAPHRVSIKYQGGIGSLKLN